MRSGFGGHLNTSPFGITDKCNACFGADMADMNRLVKSGGKCNFSCSSAVLGTGRDSLDTELFRNLALVNFTAVGKEQVLAMCDNCHAELWSFFHCVTQILCVFNRSAVIGKCYCTCTFHSVNVCGFFAFKPLGNACRNINTAVGVFSFVKNILYNFGAVGCGVGVRHCKQACNTACGSRLASRDNILFVSLTGITKMHMHINKSRNGTKTVCINNLSV